jgi:hypothetical protein
MSANEDVQRFAEDPSLLVELCRDVIDHIDSGDDEVSVADQEIQLRTIAKAVEQLEKSGVAVPDSLRAEKTHLVASLALRRDAKQALTQLADEFQEIASDLRTRIGQDASNPAKTKKAGKRSKLPRTSKEVLREQILLALRTLGGRAQVVDVIAEMARQLEGKLLPGDKVWRESTNEPAWKNNAKWERYRMTQDGTLRPDSPRGIWELGEDHR